MKIASFHREQSCGLAYVKFLQDGFPLSKRYNIGFSELEPILPVFKLPAHHDEKHRIRLENEGLLKWMGIDMDPEDIDKRVSHWGLETMILMKLERVER